MIAICLLGSAINQVLQHLIVVRLKTHQTAKKILVITIFILLNSAFLDSLQNAYLSLVIGNILQSHCNANSKNIEVNVFK